MARVSREAWKEQLEMDIVKYEAYVQELRDTVTALEATVRLHNDMPVTDTDPALAGAKQAYIWIYKKTGDTAAAVKAFDSYLLGGRYHQGETFSEGPFNAEGEIAACKNRSLKTAQKAWDDRDLDDLEEY